jgi:hypothetical protein
MLALVKMVLGIRSEEGKEYISKYKPKKIYKGKK